jgi:enoyl-CoA hydratase/carnithine racemase
VLRDGPGPNAFSVLSTLCACAAVRVAWLVELGRAVSLEARPDLGGRDRSVRSPKRGTSRTRQPGAAADQLVERYAGAEGCEGRVLRALVASVSQQDIGSMRAARTALRPSSCARWVSRARTRGLSSAPAAAPADSAPAAAAAATPAWAFRQHPNAFSTLQCAELSAGASFYAQSSLAQMMAQLQPGDAAQRATLQSADYGLLELAEHDSSAAWVVDPANAAALEDPATWRALYQFRCCATPVVALLPNSVVRAGPSLLAPIVVCQPETLVVAAIPSGGDASAVVMPGTSSVLGRLGGGMGQYLATTGHALPAAEALHAGLVTHVLDNHASRSLLCDSLCVLSEGRRFDHAVEAVDDLSVLDPPSLMRAGDDDDDDDSFTPLGQLVEESFGAAASREDLLQSLEGTRDQDGPGALWAQACLDSLNAQPAWQVRLTLALVNAASDRDEATCLALEHYVVSYIADRRRAGDDLDAVVTPLAAAAMYEELVELAQSSTGSDISASWGGMKPQFPFSPDQNQYLDYVRYLHEADLGGSSPGKQRRAEAALAELNTLRGGLEAVRWMNVQSQLLDYVEDLVDEARLAGLETGPMGEKIGEMLREEDGRRVLQPILTVAAERGMLFVEDVDSESESSPLHSGEIHDAYRYNYECVCLLFDLLPPLCLVPPVLIATQQLFPSGQSHPGGPP